MKERRPAFAVPGSIRPSCPARKLEIRSTKHETSPDSSMTKTSNADGTPDIREVLSTPPLSEGLLWIVGTLGFGICFGFRNSIFVLGGRAVDLQAVAG